MSKIKKQPERSEMDEKHHLKGVIRDQQKRIKVLEREISRLKKYLTHNAQIEVEFDENDIVIKAPKREREWECVACGCPEFNDTFLPLPNGEVRSFRVCQKCYKREKLNDDKSQ